jgi:hypothetical protein
VKGNCGPCSRATNTWTRSALYVTATPVSLGGVAFVEKSNHNEAEIAIHKLNGTNLAGCRIQVNEARPRTERGRGFGSGGGNRGGWKRAG